MVQDWRPQEVAETLGCDWSPAGIVLEGRGPGSQICSHSQLPFPSMGLGGHLQNDSVVVRWIQISSLRPPLQRCNLSCSDQLTEVSFTCLESTKSAGFLSIRNYSPWMGGREELIWETFQKQGLHILHPVDFFAESWDRPPGVRACPVLSHSDHLWGVGGVSLRNLLKWNRE